MLMTFKQYLEEAAFNEKNINLVAKKLERVLAKKMGMPLHRFDGKNGTIELQVKGGKAIGVQYFYGNKKSFRLNWHKLKGRKSVELSTISVWKNFKWGTDPNFTVVLSDGNIVQSIDTIVKILKNPRVGTFNITLGEGVLVEAKKRTNIAGFRQAAITIIGRGDNLTRQEIKQVSDESQFNIPKGTFDNKVSRRKCNLFYD